MWIDIQLKPSEYQQTVVQEAFRLLQLGLVDELKHVAEKRRIRSLPETKNRIHGFISDSNNQRE